MHQLLNLYENCKLCPNHCKVNRLSGEVGICKATSVMRLSYCGLHRGEEPPVSGKNGSGMLFFAGCSLHCAYCQNFQISQSALEAPGIDISITECASLMLALQDFGANSINLVTASHYLPSVILAIQEAKKGGLKLPIVYNSSGYEDVEALKLIDKYIDLYLVDVKTLDPEVAQKFCFTKKYVDVIYPVMDFLKHNYPRTFLRKGKLYGVLVRHLVFPGTLNATFSFLSWYAKNFKNQCYLSLMVQFVPPKEDNASLTPLSRQQYDALQDRLEALEIDNGFYQEFGESAGFEQERLWIPDFNLPNPFPASFSDPLPLFLQMKAGKEQTNAL